MGELAELIRELAGDSSIIYTQRPVDDSEMRRPDTTLARDLLDWKPRAPLRDGLARTVEWMRASMPEALKNHEQE